MYYTSFKLLKENKIGDFLQVFLQCRVSALHRFKSFYLHNILTGWVEFLHCFLYLRCSSGQFLFLLYSTFTQITDATKTFSGFPEMLKNRKSIFHLSQTSSMKNFIRFLAKFYAIVSKDFVVKKFKQAKLNWLLNTCCKEAIITILKWREKIER